MNRNTLVILYPTLPQLSGHSTPLCWKSWCFMDCFLYFGLRNQFWNRFVGVHFIYENWHSITPVEGTINPNFNNYPYLERAILTFFVKQKTKSFLNLKFYGHIFFKSTLFFTETFVYHGHYQRLSNGDLKSFTDRDMKIFTARKFFVQAFVN